MTVSRGSGSVTGGSTFENYDEDNVTIKGGSINNTTIGAGTASTGDFTTLTSNDLSSTTFTLGSGSFTTVTDLGTVGTAAFTAIIDLGAVTTCDINGGTIDATPIGQTTPVAGSFTDLDADVIAATVLSDLPPTTGGTTTAYTVTLGISALETDRIYRVNFHTAGTATGATINIDGTGALTIKDRNGESVIPPAGPARVWYDGTDAKLLDIASVLTTETPIATTSGTYHDFTDIPPWSKKIIITIYGLSTSGTSPYIIQIGDSGGIETTGYTGAAGVYTPSSQDADVYTTGFGMRGDPTSASVSIDGIGELILMDPDNNTWVWKFNGARSDAGEIYNGSGTKSLSSILTQLRLTTVGGTNTFDSGKFNIMYE